jgi:hypothetical protein
MHGIGRIVLRLWYAPNLGLKGEEMNDVGLVGEEPMCIENLLFKEIRASIRTIQVALSTVNLTLRLAPHQKL